jgi:hypothetical protein
MLDATQALTILAELDPGPTPRALLEHRLAEIAAAPEQGPGFSPGQLPATHFMRFVIVDDPRGELPSLLVWESNHDGRAADYLAAVARAAPGIDAVFACCADYPRGAIRDVDRWVAWMLARSHRAAAFYAAYRGVPRQTVLNDRRVHDVIREVLDEQDRTTLAGLPRPEIQRRLRAEVAARAPDLDLSPTGDEELRWALGKLFAGLAALALLPAVAVLAVPWYLVLRRKETTDIATAYARPVEIDPAVQDAEDRGLQNELTHVVEIKPGAFRLVTLWLVLAAIGVLAKVYSVRGNLAGITSIHFARWVIVRDRRPGPGPRRHRLLFLSSFDGSWEGYLGEFVDRAAPWLTAVWSNTVGFPLTERLAQGGARDEYAFKQWTREHQIPTQLFWSGVPDSTAQNIRDDTWIRRRLGRALADDELAAWLRKL